MHFSKYASFLLFSLFSLPTNPVFAGRSDSGDLIGAMPTDAALDALRAVAEQLPRRLVLALDGLAYLDVHQVQSVEKRCMQTFYPASRAVSVYPSLSDVSWADILHSAPPAGYQRYYFSTRRNQIVGGSLADLGNPQEYEHRMHLVFDKLTQHAEAYVASFKMAKKEIRGITEKFFEARNIPNFYAYMLTTDTVGHTDGDMQGLVCYLDEHLQAMQAKYKAVTGRDLEIVIMSDHGNNHASQGTLTDLKTRLRDHGYKISSSIQGPKDVAFTTGGILTSASVFMKSESLADVTDVAVHSSGVDLVTYIDLSNDSTVYVRKPNGDMARVVFDRATGRYGYTPVVGDPLGYLPTIERMRAAGRLDERGFGTDQDWVDFTTEHEYPVAPVRIYRGHHEITRNPSPLIVSLADGYEITYGFVKAMSRMHKRGGTHGSLSAKGSNGVLITNFKPTHDVYTAQVADFIQLDRMRPYQDEERGSQIVDSTALGYDLDHDTIIAASDNLGPQNDVFLNLWDPTLPEWQKLGMRTEFRIKAQKAGMFHRARKKISERVFVANSLPHSSELDEFRIPMNLAIRGVDEPGKYWATVYVRRVDEATGAVVAEEKFWETKFFTDMDGLVVAY